MPRTLNPLSDKALNCYHQKQSWKISKDDWNSDECLFLKLRTMIPGTLAYPHLGWAVSLSRERNCLGFLTLWPKIVDYSKISLNAIFTINLDAGTSVRIECDQTGSDDENCQNPNSTNNSIELNLRLD